jgi:CheY-like chemotaxis protein/anti-sigma regulatory factor (Ser/Thr protein kinase)
MSLTEPLRTLVGTADEQMRSLFCEALEATGRFAVAGEAADGHRAVALARELQPRVVVLDLELPGLDGLTALPQVREVCRSGAVIVVAAIGLLPGSEADGRPGQPTRPELLEGARRLAAEIMSLVDGAVPVAGEDAVQWHLPADPFSGALARKRLRELLGRWDLDGLRDEVELLATELVNNAVVHAGSPVLVTVKRRGETLRLEVTDIGEGLPDRDDAALTDTSGRGLLLVDAISDDWGTAVNGHAKTVWFELATAAG